MAYVLKNLEHGAIEIEEEANAEPLNRQEYDRVQNEWSRLATEAATSATGKITGRIEVTAAGRSVFGTPHLDKTKRSGIAATLEIVPMLRLLQGSFTHTHAFNDRDRVRIVQCNEDGTFEVSRLCRGEYRVTIIAKGLARTEQTVMLGNDTATAELDLLLNQADEITGTVIDAAGQPIAGAKIGGTKRHFNPDYIPQQTSAHLPAETTTDDNGNFVFDVLFVRAYTFKVEADGYESIDTVPTPAGKQGISIKQSLIYFRT